MIEQEMIEEILIPENQIQKKVKQLGEQISQDYAGKELFLIGILKGAIIFLADLVRYIKVPMLIDFIAISSYGVSTESSGVVRILKDLDENIEKKDVLIVEDIVDSGNTMVALKKELEKYNPLEVKVATLLFKPAALRQKLHIDYVALEIPNDFIVGYGLDYDGYGRNLKDIYKVK